jgi:TatD DNase family protein
MDFALKNHFYLGISGPITFKNAMTLQAAVKNIPITKLLIETDSPYLAPHPHRGQRNEPANVWFIAEKLAEIIEIPLEKVIEQTTANAMELFRTN